MRWGQEEEAYEQFWKDLAEEHPSMISAHGAIHQVGGIAFSWQDLSMSAAALKRLCIAMRLAT
jgi:hypothetical protein